MSSQMQRQRVLPIRRCKERIVDKVKLNRVTLIFADTGSGKSSQVPQMLLEEGLAPILCTQPRRLAVVAVSKLVAQERGCRLGEEVGYHIGQKKVATARSRIVFETAGVFLEELRCEGAKAISRYKVIILDEVHERSIESDLVLTCIKQFMLRNGNIRLVLMSATADSFRYKEFFKDIDRGEKVEIIPIQSLAGQLQNLMFTCSVRYLEQVVDLLGKVPDHEAILSSMQANALPYEKGTNLGEGNQKMITDLIVHLHKSDPELSSSILVFLPTYRALEQQWSLLKSTGLPLKLYALHSSIDMEHSIRAMEACHSERKVILATNVAESSVTMPGVSHVIDSCRSLEIFWDNQQNMHLPRLVWISQSQADQRKGRTGRTCDGKVYRMVPRSLFHNFEKFETPSMQLLSLRKQVLMLTCAESKAVNDPIVLFQRALDPPAQQTLENALETLQSIDAVKAPSDLRGKYLPTSYGKLLASLPLSLEAAQLLTKGGQVGLLREIVVLAVLMDSTPIPILRPFGSYSRYQMHVERYYQGAGSSLDSPPSGRNTLSYATVLIANLYAFEFWQCVFKDHQRLERLVRLAGVSEASSDSDRSFWEKEEQQWCAQHHLSAFALHAVEETSASILETLHRFRPRFLNQLYGPPSYYSAYDFQHLCNLFREEDICRYWIDDDGLDYEPEAFICCEGCFVSSGTFHSLEEEERLMSLVGEVRKNSLQPSFVGENTEESVSNTAPGMAALCNFFQRGMCMKGSKCLFSHSLSARPTPCKFYLTPMGCRYGEACRFLHDGESSTPVSDVGPLELEEDMPCAESLIRLLPSVNEKKTVYEEQDNEESVDRDHVLLFGDNDFTFAERLSQHYDPSKITATCTESTADAFVHKKTTIANKISQLCKAGLKILWGVDVESLASTAWSCIPWTKIGCVFWIVKNPHDNEDTELQKDIIREFFTTVSCTFFAKGLEDVQIFLTMYNSQFCTWQVERAARDCFFFLSQSLLFDTVTFGCFRASRNTESVYNTEKPVTYVFELQPPSDDLHGKYWERFGRAF